MTFIGLFVAIPAVIAFNYFNRNNRKLIGQFDAFAHDLHDFFATGRKLIGQFDAFAHDLHDFFATGARVGGDKR